MNLKRLVIPFAFVAVLVAAPQTTILHGQAGKGIMDINAMSEAELQKLPGITAVIAKGIHDKRPFASIVDLNAFLLAQGLSQEQATAIYDKAFVHLNLNTATAPEILLIPRVARRMTREFEEYRPWKTMAQFDKEIGKYVGADETNRLKMYVFIPINLNTATDEDIMSIPGIAARMLREFKEYRPWKTKEQFMKEIGKYVGEAETARLWRFVIIE